MCTTLYQRAVEQTLPISWRQHLPLALKDVVVPPIHFEVRQDYEVAADRTKGYDSANQPCFCAFRYVLTQLRSDDDELFYEAPIYSETLTSWRLPDNRWLVCHTRIANADRGEVQTRLSLRDSMPR